MATEARNREEAFESFRIRHADLPAHKEKVISQLFGEFIGFVNLKGLKKGKEYETQIKEIFSCSKKVLWIDDYHPELQITIYLNSIQMFVEYGVKNKKTNEMMHRNKIENLRYNISSGSPIELTDGSRKRFDKLFAEFEEFFALLEKELAA